VRGELKECTSGGIYFYIVVSKNRTSVYELRPQSNDWFKLTFDLKRFRCSLCGNRHIAQQIATSMVLATPVPFTKDKFKVVTVLDSVISWDLWTIVKAPGGNVVAI
jgi:hypothetical protein